MRSRAAGAGIERDGALSEVVGFVLIIGVLVVVASLYMTYSVPAQGRENEILHMNAVKDQFVSYKIGLDSLFNNNKIGTTVANSFTLGTGGGYTQGVFSYIPVMSPLSSSGVMAINQRTEVPETLTVQSSSLVANSSVFYAENLPTTVNYTPSHIYIKISGIQSSDLSSTGRFGVTINGNSWNAIVNITPRLSHYNETASVTSCNPGPCVISYREGNRYTNSDITINVAKKNLLTLQDTIIYRNISANKNYLIDLMDEAYGIRSSISPNDYISIGISKPLGSITATGNASYNFADMGAFTITPIKLGALEYRAQNNYWISQNYYYQMGGVFLQQSDGNTTYKLPPEITFSYDNNTDVAKKIVTVNINALAIDPNNRGIVGGNSPVQIRTTLANITAFPYASGSANTRWIRIGINTTDSQARQMWKNYFHYTATVAGIPHYDVSESGTESYILIKGYDESPSGRFDINVIASNATYSTSVHGIGGIVE